MWIQCGQMGLVGAWIKSSCCDENTMRLCTEEDWPNFIYIYICNGPSWYWCWVRRCRCPTPGKNGIVAERPWFFLWVGWRSVSLKLVRPMALEFREMNSYWFRITAPFPPHPLLTSSSDIFSFIDEIPKNSESFFTTDCTAYFGRKYFCLTFKLK